VIQVTRFNGSQFYLNPDLIQSIESTPDTVITLTNNVKMVVKEAPTLVVDRIIEYRHRVTQGIVTGHEEK
jgi:flagellar protein FlbD